MTKAGTSTTESKEVVDLNEIIRKYEYMTESFEEKK